MFENVRKILCFCIIIVLGIVTGSLKLNLICIIIAWVICGGKSSLKIRKDHFNLVTYDIILVLNMKNYFHFNKDQYVQQFNNVVTNSFKTLIILIF